MKKLLLSLAACLLISTNGQAALVTNGDFQTCDLTGWQKDTDGFGDPGATGDFAVIDNAGACSAQIYVDDLDTSTAFAANTLFTDLDLSAAADQILSLSFDWLFEGTDGDALLGDFFSVYLGDGSGDTFNEAGKDGFLIEPVSEYGSGTFTIDLDAALYNQMGWTLEFQLFDAISPTADILYSSLLIDNVQITASSSSSPINAPVSSMMLMFGVAFLFIRNTRKTRL